MKKLLLPIILFLVLVISACTKEAAEPTSNNTQGQPSSTVNTTTDSGTIVYQSENGPIQIPANPKRIIALTNAPNVLALGGSLVGVDEWTKMNPLFTDKLNNIETVSEDSLEKIVALDPDLIITGASMKNTDKLSEIAPTIVYTWGKLDYLEQQLEIGKVLNKEKETQAWIEDFKNRATAIGAEIKAKAGENVTVSVIEYDTENYYVFGNNWARGTEILYQAMGLQMAEKAKQDALGPGYYTLSQEAIPQYAGDFIVLSRKKGSNNPFLQSETWKSIPAVKNNRIIEIDTEESTYSDPITLEHLLAIFKEQFLAKS